VIIAVQFSFNDGRSRSTFQGFSTQWYEAIWDQTSENYDDTLLPALRQSLKLALLTMPIATALGVGLAIGLARWRGRGSGAANFLMLFPLVTPEIVMGAAMFLILVNLYHVRLGTTAQLLGHVTFSLSYVVIVTRGRLFAVGRDYEEAAMDLGASPANALRRVLLPLLAPAIFSSFFIVFAISIDDFVISQFLCAQDCVTIPIKIYSAARNAGNPSLNALATIMMLLSLLSITVAVLILRRFNRRHGTGRSAVEDFARFEI
jgi:spermidine/putrescine transport system permease protein